MHDGVRNGESGWCSSAGLRQCQAGRTPLTWLGLPLDAYFNGRASYVE